MPLQITSIALNDQLCLHEGRYYVGHFGNATGHGIFTNAGQS